MLCVLPHILTGVFGDSEDVYTVVGRGIGDYVWTDSEI